MITPTFRGQARTYQWRPRKTRIGSNPDLTFRPAEPDPGPRSERDASLRGHLDRARSRRGGEPTLIREILEPPKGGFGRVHRHLCDGDGEIVHPPVIDVMGKKLSVVIEHGDGFPDPDPGR